MRLLRSALPGLLALSTLSAQAPALSSHEKAARELYVVSGGRENAMAGAETMLSSMGTTNPQLAEYTDVLRAWVDKVLGGEGFHNEVAAVFMTFYTEEEINGLIAFYKTPLGRKVIKSMPEVVKAGGEIGAKRAQAHMEELKTMILEAMKTRHPEMFKEEKK